MLLLPLQTPNRRVLCSIPLAADHRQTPSSARKIGLRVGNITEMAEKILPLRDEKDGNCQKISELESAEVIVNASGHKQELERNFSLLSICGIGITTGNTWIAMGGSIVCCVLLLLSACAVRVVYCGRSHIDW